MVFQQGEIVLASDPFKEDKSSIRPFIIVNTSNHPYYGSQYTMMSLSTQEHEQGIEIKDEYLSDGTLERQSFALPWSLASIQSDDILKQVATLESEIVDTITSALISYISPEQETVDCSETASQQSALQS